MAEAFRVSLNGLNRVEI